MANSDLQIELLEKLQSRLHELMDRDPRAAIQEALGLKPSRDLSETDTQSVQGAILIDAGFAARDSKAVAQGVEILTHLEQRHPEQLELAYNLANGLTNLADLREFKDPTWYLDTSESRRRARHLYQRCVDMGIDSAELKATSCTNLGNALIKAFRFVEAYDYYTRALTFDPTNTIAAAGAARILIHFANSGLGDRSRLLAIANHHLAYARNHPERFRELAGEQAYQALAPLLSQQFPAHSPPDLDSATEYQRFVAEHRIALSLAIDGQEVSLKRWDSLQLPGISVPRDAPRHVPIVFATFNTLKAEFLAARHLAFQALHNPPPESGQYGDTLDYAIYGVESASLVLAQRACIDILDKLAVGLRHYLGEDDPGNYATFLNSFYKKDRNPPEWTLPIHQEIWRGNRGLLAVAELSFDVSSKGFLSSKRKLRNAATHRFVVLHDISRATAPKANIVERYDLDEFKRHLIETLQLARSALFYFTQTVADREGRTPVELTLPFEVPDHDWIRGRDE